MALAAIRDQPVDLVDPNSGNKVCTVKAGPKTHIHHVKKDVETAIGLPGRQQKIKFDGHTYNDEDTIGIHLFKDLTPGEVPVLHFFQLTPEEADEEEGRKHVLERIAKGIHLDHIEEKYRSDPEVVLHAVEHTNASELQHASDSVKADPRAMIQALSISTNSKYYVAESLWNDRAFMVEAMQVDGLLLGSKDQVPEFWRSDVEIVMYACEQNGMALQFADQELRASRPVVIAAVNQRGTCLMYASEELRSDYHIVLDAVRNHKMAIVHAKGGLRDDDEIRAAAGQAAHVDHDKIQKISKKFHQLDVNGDGYLSYEELESLLRSGNPDMGEDECRLLYDDMNSHQDGRVDFHEFCEYIFKITG